MIVGVACRHSIMLHILLRIRYFFSIDMWIVVQYILAPLLPKAIFHARNKNQRVTS